MAKKKAKGKGHRGSEVKAPPKGSGAPPSVKARDVTRAGKPPPEKYAGKKKPPRMGWGGGVPDMPDWARPPKGPPPPTRAKPRPKPRPKPKGGPAAGRGGTGGKAPKGGKPVGTGGRRKK